MGITNRELDSIADVLKEYDFIVDHGTGRATITMAAEMPKLMSALDKIKRSWEEAPISHGRITFEIPQEHRLSLNSTLEVEKDAIK